MLRFALLLLALLVPALASAQCQGRDLIAALPEPEHAALMAATAAQPYSTGNLWRASRGDQVIHLLGTYHLPDSRHERMLARVTPLLGDATVLLVEAGPEEEIRLKAEVLRRPEFMFLTEGPTLPELLGDPDWSAVSAEMTARGIPPFVAAKFRPWYMAMMLGIPPCAMASAKAGARGLDHQLITAAQAAGVPVAPLEPYDTLFSIFGDLTLEQEIEMIRATLLMADRPEDMTVTLANSYFAGQPWLLWEFARAQALAAAGPDQAGAVVAQFSLMQEVLMARRNQSWVPVLLAAAERGPVLAAAGALHLPGQQGVLALLAAEGFDIERLDQ